MASPQDTPIHPLYSSYAGILRRTASSQPTRRATLEPIPPCPTPPSAAVSSTTTSIETASASPKHTGGSHPTRHKESDRAERPQEPKPHIKGEKQQDSSREESNMEGILVDIGDHMEADNDVGVSSGAGVKPERYYPNKRPQMASGHRNPSRYNRITPDVTDSYKAQSAKLLDAEGTIIEKDRQINALTETISRLHQRDGGTSRDDDYLTAQFSDITNSITAWTVNNFRKKDPQKMITDLNELPAGLAQMVREVVFDSTNILVSIPSRRNLVNALVVRAIFLCIFRPFLFGAREAGEHLLTVWPQLQGTDYQKQRWRALTVNLLAQGPGYENQYDQEISSIALTLANLLAHLEPVESDAEARNAELQKIVGRAAALSVEIHKQTDLIYLSPVEPGALFESNFMEDLGYDYELHELEGKAVVQVPIFPAVVRRSCAPGGILSDPHYVMKARVTTMFVKQG